MVTEADVVVHRQGPSQVTQMAKYTLMTAEGGELQMYVTYVDGVFIAVVASLDKPMQDWSRFSIQVQSEDVSEKPFDGRLEGALVTAYKGGMFDA